MHYLNIEGCITAMITPFKEDLKINYEVFAENIKYQIRNNVKGIVVLGTTGEAPTLKEEEKIELIKIAVREAKKKILVIAGTGTYSTEETINFSKKTERLDVDALLIVSPYYNKPTQEGIYRHFKKISEKVSIPIIVYNIPGRTGVNIEVNTLLRLSKLKNIIAVKESSGNINQVMDIIKNLPKDFTVLSGDDNLTFPIISLGGKGVISVISNLFPKLVSEMVNNALKGNLLKAREMHYKLLPIFKAAFIETNPIPIKTMMNILNMKAGPCRPPLCEMKKENVEKIKEIIEIYKNY